MMLASPGAVTLVTLLRDSGRGPRREGLFALWLTLRVAEDLAEGALAERTHRRRVTALERRLSSLALPPPLRRGLQAAVAELRAGAPDGAALALSHLVAPAREGVGADAAEALGKAARRVAATLQQRYR